MSTSAAGSRKWSAEAERDLYGACLVAMGLPKAADLNKACEILRETQGLTITPKAASHRIQHLQKLKRKEGAAVFAGSADAGPSKKPAPGGKKRPKPVSDDEEVEEPTKKLKPNLKGNVQCKGKGKAATPVLASDSGDDESAAVMDKPIVYQ
ncbi:unnamed protein product [Discula destructiva]